MLHRQKEKSCIGLRDRPLPVQANNRFGKLQGQAFEQDWRYLLVPTP
jgi:hypothetical protein